MSTATEKKFARNVLSLMNVAISKAMESIDAHEGRYMKRELNFHETLSGSKQKGIRKYVHTSEYWAKKHDFKAIKPIVNRCPECGTTKPFIHTRKVKTPEWHCCKCQHEWDKKTAMITPLKNLKTWHSKKKQYKHA